MKKILPKKKGSVRVKKNSFADFESEFKGCIKKSKISIPNLKLFSAIQKDLSKDRRTPQQIIKDMERVKHGRLH